MIDAKTKTKHGDTLFTAGMFTDTQFDSAKDKADFANKFVRFVRSGFNRNLFTKKFYNRLSNCFGHIAHYNIDGFYGVWFEDSKKRYSFLAHAANHAPCGDPYYTYSDVERHLRSWVENSGVLNEASDTLKSEIEKEERAELDRLTKKYGTPSRHASNKMLPI